MPLPWTDAAPNRPPLRTTVLVARPADEILSLGGQLAQMGSLTLVHVTDGAPRTLQDACPGSRESRIAARARELERALAAAGVRHARRRELGLAEHEAAQHLAELVQVLAAELTHSDVILTHPYEGGDPDHDACAFAVQAACTLLWLLGAVPPQRVEFACYHARDGRRCAGRFWEAPECPEQVITLTDAQRSAKRAALTELVTSAPPDADPDEPAAGVERLRAAPRYDFRRPPPPQELLYERQDGGAAGAQTGNMTGALWRSQAQAALRTLGLD